MSLYWDPNNLTPEGRAALLKWMRSEGVRDLIAWEPIRLDGKTLTYRAIGRDVRRVRIVWGWDGWPFYVTKLKTQRIRTQPPAVLPGIRRRFVVPAEPRTCGELEAEQA